MGRPSTYSPEVAKALCERAVTRSLRAVCLDDDMPAEGTVYGWLRDHEDFSKDYARAREVRAYRRGEDMDELVDQVRTGDIKPDAARVMMDAMKWQAGRENAKFGDKIQQEVTGKDGGPIETKGEVLVRPSITRQEWMEAHGLDTPAGTPASGA